MATTTTKTAKKKKLVYQQDPDGVFRLKKINDDTSSLKTNEIINKKAQVDNYLNELIDCSYSIIDDDDDQYTGHTATATATAEQNFNKITTPATVTTTATGNTTTARRKKIKPTTINTSSKNLKLKTTSPIPTITNTIPIEPQRIIIPKKSEPSPPPPPPLHTVTTTTTIPSPSSPTLTNSSPTPTEFIVKKSFKVADPEEAEEEEEEEVEIETEEEQEMIQPKKPTLLTRLLRFHVPSFVVGVISTFLGLRYKEELIYAVLGLTIIGVALGAVSILGICSCLYMGLIKTEDLKKYAGFFLKPKIIEETVSIKKVPYEPPIAEHKTEVGHEKEEQEEVADVYQPENHYEEEEEVEEENELHHRHQVYQPEELYDEHIETQYPVQQHHKIPLPEAYLPLPEPKPPKPKRTSSTVRVKPYRHEQRDNKVFNVVPVNNSIPLTNIDTHYHVKTKPELTRSNTEPSRQNSRRRKSESSSPTSAKSDNYYPNTHQHQSKHKLQQHVGVPPQLLKIKQLPNLPPQAEELPFINEVRLVDVFQGEHDADDVDIPSEAPAYHYKTGSSHNQEFLKRNQSTMSKQSVLGTRTNYNKFVSNVHDDYEY